MFNNNKGYSTGFAWVFALVSLFGLGLLYIVFNQVFMGYLVPSIKDIANTTLAADDASRNAVFAGVDNYMRFFHIVPYVLFFVIVLFMILTSIRKEREENL